MSSCEAISEKKTRPVFPTQDQFIDAMMLFGASLSRNTEGSGVVSLVVARTPQYLRQLGFAVILAHVQGIELRLVGAADPLDPDGKKITYKSPGSLSLVPSFERWYPPAASEDDIRPAVTPGNLDLGRLALAVWLVDAVSARRSDRIVLRGPRLSLSRAGRLVYRIRMLGFKDAKPAPTSGGFYSIVLPESALAGAEKLMGEYFPPDCWKPSVE
jgi:hypothetical protein